MKISGYSGFFMLPAEGHTTKATSERCISNLLDLYVLSTQIQIFGTVNILNLPSAELES